jgi:membrane fusion protein (multidrug efflux system)
MSTPPTETSAAASTGLPKEAPQEAPNQESKPPSRLRRWGFIGLGAVVVLGGVGYVTYWSLYARHFETTDDAYVNGDVVQVTNDVAGTVIALHIDDTQAVIAGQPLVELDPADATIAEANAEAELARTVRAVRGLFAQSEQLQAQINFREQALRTAVADLKRRQDLLRGGAISAEELSHVGDNVTSARANLVAAREQLSQTMAQIEGTTILTHPQVMAAASAVRNAALALHRTHVTSAVTGVIAQRSVQVGQRVAAGTPLLAVVPMNDVWVDANFKEVQLSRMRVGQPVTVRTDVYGGVVFHGRITGLGAGSGNAFALLPPQNASGNWIKIVQRVPVRILLDPLELRSRRLLIGLSATVRVDVRDLAGPAAVTAMRNTPQPTQDSAGDDPAVNVRIAEIIADNAGPALGKAAGLSKAHSGDKPRVSEVAANGGTSRRAIAPGTVAPP